MTLDKLRAHVVELAAAFRIQLHLIPDMPYEWSHVVPDSVVSERHASHIMVRPINSEEEYAVALHEIGHVQHPSGYLRGRAGREKRTDVQTINLVLTEEECAWIWAEANALMWTAPMEGVRRVTLQCYDNLAQEITRRAVLKTAPPKPRESLDDFLRRRT